MIWSVSSVDRAFDKRSRGNGLTHSCGSLQLSLGFNIYRDLLNNQVHMQK